MCFIINLFLVSITLLEFSYLISASGQPYDFILNSALSTSRENNIVKRRIFEFDQYTDNGLKEIPLQNLIGNLEHSLIRSADSLSSVTSSSERLVTKRNADTDVIEAESPPQSNEFVSHTLKTFPQVNNGPSGHLLIDRATVQEHFGGLPMVPPFGIFHPIKRIAAILSSAQTPLSIVSTELSSSAPKLTHKTETTSPSVEEVSSSTTRTAPANETTIAIVNEFTEEVSSLTRSPAPPTETNTLTEKEILKEVSSSTPRPITPTETTTPTVSEVLKDVSSSTTRPTPPAETTTTTRTIIQNLKEVEEELKEKVAEIEAEPIILSARV